MPSQQTSSRPIPSFSNSRCTRLFWRAAPRRAALGAAILLAPGIALAQMNAAFAGQVQDQTSKPLPGVSVKYLRIPTHVLVTEHGHKRLQEAPNEPVASGIVTSATDGSLSVSALPPGDYYICAIAPTPAFEDPCLWRGYRKVTLQAGGKTPLAPVTIRSGAQIHFQVSDPNHIVPGTANLGSLAIIGVRAGNGAFRPATMSSRTASGAQFDITVPTDMPVYLWAFSRAFKFQGQDGKPIAPRPTPTSKAGLIPIVMVPGITDYTIPLTLIH